MNKHIDPGASGSTQVNIHPHPCVFFKNSIDSMGSMSLFNPFVIPFVLAVPILITLRHAAIQLMLNDSHRVGEQGTLALVGKPGSGKSTILNGIR